MDRPTTHQVKQTFEQAWASQNRSAAIKSPAVLKTILKKVGKAAKDPAAFVRSGKTHIIIHGENVDRDLDMWGGNLVETVEVGSQTFRTSLAADGQKTLEHTFTVSAKHPSSSVTEAGFQAGDKLQKTVVTRGGKVVTTSLVRIKRSRLAPPPEDEVEARTPSVYTKQHPWGSATRNSEDEGVATRIMLLLKETGDAWRPVSWKEYSERWGAGDHFAFERVRGYTSSSAAATKFSDSWMYLD